MADLGAIMCALLYKPCVMVCGVSALMYLRYGPQQQPPQPSSRDLRVMACISSAAERSPQRTCHSAADMPLYELLCLARPVLQREDLRRMIAKVGRTVYDKGGVVMDVKSYGLHPLAYKIRGVHGKYDQVG
jgi:hypothetical protein